MGTLRKANAVVQEKLCHHTCIDALKLCGFIDTGDAFVCRPAADLEPMRKMVVGLRAHPPEQIATAGAAAQAGPARKPVKSAFDFESRAVRESAEQRQASELEEVRRRQRERYNSGAGGVSTSQQSQAPTQGQRDSDDRCTVQ